MSNKIRIVLPAVEESQLADMMRELTRTIVQTIGTDEEIQGLLGGEYGYGANYNNSVFEMRSFYWGDCECEYFQKLDDFEFVNPHDTKCYQTFLNSLHYEDAHTYQEKAGHKVNDDCTDIACKEYGINPELSGAWHHCTCGITQKYLNFIESVSHGEACLVDKPNFHHYESGLKVEWYKYIGRDMEYDKNVSPEKWAEVLSDCINSLKNSK